MAGTGDYGWSLLHPDTRRDIFADDDDAYEALVQASEFDDFRWNITGGAWEEYDLYFTFLEIPGGADSIPEVLRDANGYVLLVFDEGSKIGQLNVWLPVLGTAGITPSGATQ